MKENLAYNFNRFFVGITIILALFCSYFLDLDLFFYFVVSIFIFYEFYRSVLKNKYIIAFLLTLFVFLFYILNFLINNHIFILISTLFFILFSIYFNKYFDIFFILFVINILILISNLFIVDKNIIYLIIIISFTNDTIAYIIGSNIKGPLISPNISPKKTWSGTLASFFISALLFIYLDYNLFISAIMAISLFYGDIYFSYIKRKLGIKDFSNLLLTHGGLLDRLDSITFLIIIFGFLKL